MTEKEFEALLAIEGKQLDVGQAFRQIGEVKEHGYLADVNEGLFITHETSGFYKRRRDAVQNLIKKYYNRANNR